VSHKWLDDEESGYVRGNVDDNDGRVLCSLDHLVPYFARLYGVTLMLIARHPDAKSLVGLLDFTVEDVDEPRVLDTPGGVDARFSRRRA
jgi:hypothetical protein